MEKIPDEDADYLRKLKRQKTLNYMNNNEASTSKNVYSSNNQFEESNIEIITNCQSNFMQLSSIYNTNDGIANLFCESYNSPSSEKGNSFILNLYLFIFLYKYYFE